MFKPDLSVLFIHAAGWLMFIILPLAFISGPDPYFNYKALLQTKEFWIFCLTYLVLFYSCTGFLIPQLYFRKKFFAFAGILLLAGALVYFIRPFDKLMDANRLQNTQMRPPPDRPGSANRKPPDFRNRNIDIVSIFLFVMIIALAIALKVNRQLQLTKQEALKAESDKTAAELSFLKAQINPHFLFNTLNNIYSMAVTNNPATAESIMRLSNMMRYVTDDMRQSLVSLKDETDCINNFIGLQKLRLSDTTKVNFSVGGRPELTEIPPMILMTFVENAFKYGVSNHNKSEIFISIDSGDDSTRFVCRNHIVATEPNIHNTGIGIENARRRLQNIYSDKYNLHIDSANQIYTVELQIWSQSEFPDL